MIQSLSSKRRIKEEVTRPFFKKRRDDYNRKLRRDKLEDYLRKELADYTIHGVPYIVNQDFHWSERVFWTMSVLTALVFAVYLLIIQFARLIETPIVMSAEIDYFNWNVSYPAFTLCPVMKTDAATYGTLVNETNDRTGKNMESYLWAIISVDLTNVDHFQLDLPPDVVALIDPDKYAEIAAKSFKQLDEASMTTNTNWPISIEAVMTELGMCHVVNSNVAAFDNPYKWNETLKYITSNIELSIHDRDFFAQIVDYADIYKIFIHSPDETILSTTSSYTLSTKGFLSLGVSVWTSMLSDELRYACIRLRKCRLINEPISERYPIYSYNRCMLECRIKMILKICRCVPHFYKRLKGERVCTIPELKCIANYKKEIQTLSASEAMLRRFRNVKGLPRDSHECGCMSKCNSDVYQKDYENFIPQSDINRLRVGISNFPRVRVIRQIIFSTHEIMLKIGGVINLCIGASVLSMVEFVVTFVKIPIYYTAKKIKGIVKLMWHV